MGICMDCLHKCIEQFRKLVIICLFFFPLFFFFSFLFFSFNVRRRSRARSIHLRAKARIHARSVAFDRVQRRPPVSNLLETDLPADVS